MREERTGRITFQMGTEIEEGLILSHYYESVGCSMAFTAVRNNKSVPKNSADLVKYQLGSTKQVHIYLEIRCTCTYR